MSKNQENNNEKQNVKSIPIPETILTIPDKAINILDNAIKTIEKKEKTARTDKIIEKAKNSKSKGKISTNEIETDLKIEPSEIFQLNDIKLQYSEGVNIVLSLFINPFLTLKGIEPISEQEITDLISAIIELFEPNLKKIVKKAETNISFVKNIKKLLNLGRALWNIIGKRINKVREVLLKLKAKREVLKQEQLAKQKKEVNSSE